MSEKIYLNDLVIETTRRCQLQCEHCLRGDAENVDIPTRYIRELLKNVDYIGTITFTGGEPFLNPQAIHNFIDICKEYGIEVGSFYIATNALVFEEDQQHKELSDAGLLAVIRLYSFCTDNEISSVDISTDQFHYGRLSEDNPLKILSFVRDKGEILYENCISEGRAEGFSNRFETNKIEPDDLTVYLNTEGKILWNCNLSYETQREHGVSIAQGLKIIKAAQRVTA